MLLDKKTPIAYMFKKIKYDIIVIVMLGLTTHYLAKIYKDILPEMPLGIPAFLGTSISVLLSFKMNQSYDRWWEARKIWGAIVNDSRSLIIQLQSFLTENQNTSIQKIAYRQIAWCYCLGQSLRGLNPMENTNHLLSEKDLTVLSEYTNKPLGIIKLNALDIKYLREQNAFDTFTHIHLDDTLTRLCDSMGKAERINNTVFPSNYRYFLHFIIYIFVTTLSLALDSVDLMFELPLLTFISISFFLIEKSAYHLQDPFRNRPSDVSITAIARTIEINIRQLLGESNIPSPIEPEKFYLM